MQVFCTKLEVLVATVEGMIVAVFKLETLMYMYNYNYILCWNLELNISTSHFSIAD